MCEMFCINLPSCTYQLAHIWGKLIQFKKVVFKTLFKYDNNFVTIYMVYVMPTESAIRCYYFS